MDFTLHRQHLIPLLMYHVHRLSNVFSTNCSLQSFLCYLMASNNPLIHKHMDNIMRTMNKEDCNNSVKLLPTYLLWFVLGIFLMPQHNLVKKENKDSFIFNAAI